MAYVTQDILRLDILRWSCPGNILCAGHSVAYVTKDSLCRDNHSQPGSVMNSLGWKKPKSVEFWVNMSLERHLFTGRS